MKIINKLLGKTNSFYNIYIKRDPTARNVRRWFADKGDEELRLSYPLASESVVWDVGGYTGDFAEAIHRKYHCRVFLFEPVVEFYQRCLDRFSENPQVTCLNYGLSVMDGSFPIYLANDGSSLKRATGSAKEIVQVRSVRSVFAELQPARISLMKINIEGGEFDLLPELITSGLIRDVEHLQIQFHNFVPNASQRRDHIRQALHKTHRQMWNYEFVWESWKRK